MLDLSKEYLSKFHSLIEGGKDRALIKKLETLHANDIALILNQIKRDDVHYLYRLLADDARSDVLAELDEEVREDLLATLTSKEIAEDVIDGLASDDAADIISELSSEKIEEVFAHVKDNKSVSARISRRYCGRIDGKRTCSGRRNVECCKSCKRDSRSSGRHRKSIYHLRGRQKEKSQGNH